MSEAVNDVKDRSVVLILKYRWNGERTNILCNDAINSYDYVALVIDEWVIGHWWNDDDRRKARHSGETPSQVPLCP